MKNKAQPLVAIDMPWWQKYMPLLLCVGAFLLYANTIGNGYNMDDELVTRKHKLTSQGAKALKDIFTSSYYSDNMGYAYGYRPMVHVSYALEHQFFGESAAVSHFFNVLLYGICVCVFFLLLKMLSREKGVGIALVAAILFAFHPVHTEVVASIKNRDEILSLLFGLLSGIAFFKAVNKQSFFRLLTSSIWISLALLSKKSMYPLVVIYPVIFIILYPASLKTILINSLFLIVPAGIIVSEFQTVRFVPLFIFPFVILFAIYYFKKIISTPWSEAKKTYVTRLFDYRLILIVIAIISCWSTLEKNYIGLAIAFALHGLLYRSKHSWFLPAFTVWSGVIGYFISNEFGYIAVVLAAFNLIQNIHLKNKGTWLFVIILILCVSLFLLNIFEWGKVVFILTMLILFFIYEKKTRWGHIFVWGATIVSFPLSIIYGGGVFVPLIFLVIGVYQLIQTYKDTLFIKHYLLATGLCLVAIPFFVTHEFVLKKEPPIATETILTPSSISTNVTIPQNAGIALKEGRNLEFAENTLMAPHTFAEKVGTGAVTIGEYMRLMIFPYELSFYYGYAKVDTSNFANPWVWASLLFHIALLGIGLWQIKKRPFIFIGIIWYLLSIGLFSNWVELVAGMVGERLAFTASAGFCVFVAATIVWIKPDLNFKKPGAVEIIVGIVFLGFGFRTLVRNTDWKDKLTLMGNDIQHLENSAQANNLYALSLMQESFVNKKLRPEQQFNMRKLAVQHFDKAVQIWPDFFNAAYDKGRAAMSIGDYPTAIQGFEKAVSIERKDVFFDPYYQLSELYLRAGRYPDLLRNAKQLVLIDEKVESYNRVARAYYLNAKSDSALAYLRLGMAKYPGDVSLKQNMVEIFKAENKLDSVDYYRSK